MTQVLKAVFDGKVFKPEEPVKIPADTIVKLTVETPGDKKPSKRTSFLKGVAALKLKGPPDWSENFEDYLDGTRKLE